MRRHCLLNLLLFVLAYNRCMEHLQDLHFRDLTYIIDEGYYFSMEMNIDVVYDRDVRFDAGKFYN